MLKQIAHPIIAYITDFGIGATVGMMKGVVPGIMPEVQFVDIVHEVTPQDIAEGAWALKTSYRYFPAGTIFVCVVDPGVGSTRRPIALHAGAWYFVGPDNGLFTPVLAQQPLHAAVTLSNSAYHLARVSSTFHGRDIFSPVAAHLARGVTIEDVGEAIEPDTLQRLKHSAPIRQGGHIEATIAHIDHFGNLITSIPIEMVPDLFTCAHVRATCAEIQVTERRRFFADASETKNGNADGPFLYMASSDYLGIAIRNGNAARVLDISIGAPMTLDCSGQP